MEAEKNFAVARQLNEQLEGKNASEIVKWAVDKYHDRITFATSLSAEDQVVTEIISNIDKNVSFFTLDTGRLFQETYNVIEFTEEKYGIKIKTFFPDRELVEEMVRDKGINLFYYSVENRKLCCKIRKQYPLERALKGVDAWITGLRREQSVTRNNIQLIEWDDEHKLYKINPLINWTEDQVWDYINKKNIPFNSLHKKGFRSIGCLPCTRAVKPGEDIRAGRWWWENPENKECGLHLNNDGQ